MARVSQAGGKIIASTGAFRVEFSVIRSMFRRHQVLFLIMCGRFALIVDASVLADVFDVDPPHDFEPRFNIAPTQNIPIVRTGRALTRECEMVRWGLIPPWAKDMTIGAKMINARAETVAEKPSFRAAVKRRRCLVPANGFYEWVTTKNGKRPYFIHFEDRRTFAFAGLWERWTARGGASLESCTIITTTANELISDLHHRMPVILPPEHHGEWLRPESLTNGRLNELLVPHPDEGMAAYQVSTHVNRPANDDAECIARVS
jgi:putative SOS response-associated peptidase YedK